MPTTPTDPATEPVDPATDPTTDPTTDATTDDASLAAGAVTAKPMIYSRAQWGADERMRDESSLHYGEVHAGFVHHTVNANNYTAAQVPAIIRGIYAYHTQSRGWSDVGYNFLVDRFGRIWEGRYGGVDRPVVGAHTLGYNDDAFAMSAIGNFETAQPSAAVLDAYGRLFAWKLSLHGVSAGSTRQWVTKQYLPAINGHRDVGQTACPGKYLYAQIPRIRQLAAAYQKSFASRNRTANLTGTAAPDVALRDRTTKQGYVLRSGGSPASPRARSPRSGLSGVDLLTAVGDVTGDGKADLLARTRSTRSTKVLPGDGAGHFGTGDQAQPAVRRRPTSSPASATGTATAATTWSAATAPTSGSTSTTATARAASAPRTARCRCAGAATRRRRVPATSTQDGHPDLVARSSDGRLWLVPGTGGRLGAPHAAVRQLVRLRPDGRASATSPRTACPTWWRAAGPPSRPGSTRATAGAGSPPVAARSPHPPGSTGCSRPDRSAAPPPATSSAGTPRAGCWSSPAAAPPTARPWSRWAGPSRTPTCCSTSATGTATARAT